jgi:hypothetical protein
MSTLINFALVFFPGAKLYHAHHDNIGGAVFVALWVALVCVDVQLLPFYATLLIKFFIFAVVEVAALASFYFYPAFS